MGLKQTRQTLNHLTQIAPDSLGAPHHPLKTSKLNYLMQKGVLHK